MRFFDRQAEVTELTRIRELAQENSRFTVVTGRRRVGKRNCCERLFPIVRSYIFMSRGRRCLICAKISAKRHNVSLDGRYRGISPAFRRYSGS